MNSEKVNNSKLEKLKIGRRFNRAAQTYSQVAVLQRKAANHLIQLLAGELAHSKTIVDLGAGNGMLSAQLADDLIGNNDDICFSQLDIAEFMLRHGQRNIHHRRTSQVCADFDMLPYGNGSIDFIFSNMALQWSLNLPATLLELYRALSVQGTMLCSAPVAGSLFELHQSINSINPKAVVNHFIDAREINGLLSQTGFKLMASQTRKLTLFYDDFNGIIDHLHDSGTTHIKYRKSTSLSGRNFIEQLGRAYQKFSNDRGQLPMTFYIHYFKVWKRN